MLKEIKRVPPWKDENMVKYRERDMLKKARQSITKPKQMGSAGRESAYKNREEKRILAKYSPGPSKIVPNGVMIMPSREQMINEGRMDMANSPEWVRRKAENPQKIK